MYRLVHIVLFLFPLFFDKGSTEYRFGCEFKDFEIFTTNEDDAIDSFNDVNIDPVDMSNDDFHNSVMESISQIILSSMRNSVYNTMEPFRRFWNALSSSKTKNRLHENEYEYYEFFRRYRPLSFNYDPNSVMILVKVLKAIVEKHESLAPHLYFASTYVKATDNFARSLQNETELPSTFKHNYISGVLKFKKNNVVGYLVIVVDPDDGEIFHFVIYDNDFEAKTSGDMEFHIVLGALKHMIHAKRTDVPPENQNNHFLFKVENPYCSLIKVVHSELFLPRKSIVKRNNEGKFWASIYYDIPPVYFTIENIDLDGPFIIEFDTLKLHKDRLPVNEEIRQRFSAAFGAEPNDVRGKLRLPMKNDEIFMKIFSLLAKEIHGLELKPVQPLGMIYASISKKKRRRD